MDYITKEFKNTIIMMWGEEGKQWLEKLPAIVQKYIKLWKLKDVVLPEVMSKTSYVCYARTCKYSDDSSEKDVVVKVAYPHLEMYTSIHYMMYKKGNFCCSLYDFNREDCSMIMERILPGHTLRDVNDCANRIRIGIGLAHQLPFVVDNLEHFPIYETQFRETIERAVTEKLIGSEFIAKINTAKRLYKDLKKYNRETVLLHGDLHHDNILRDLNGVWKSIDPQGRVGEKILEVGRFFQNEWDMHSDEHKDYCMRFFIEEAVRILNEERKLIITSCYLDCVLSACWSVTDNHSKEKIKKALQKIEWLEGL